MFIATIASGAVVGPYSGVGTIADASHILPDAVWLSWTADLEHIRSLPPTLCLTDKLCRYELVPANEAAETTTTSRQRFQLILPSTMTTSDVSGVEPAITLIRINHNLDSNNGSYETSTSYHLPAENLHLSSSSTGEICCSLVSLYPGYPAQSYSLNPTDWRSMTLLARANSSFHDVHLVDDTLWVRSVASSCVNVDIGSELDEGVRQGTVIGFYKGDQPT